MKRNILVFGLILGIILAAFGVFSMNMIYNNPNMETNDLFGYAVMVLIFSLVFFGIRNYRNKELGGVISFGRAFKVGALIVLVGSTLYVVVGLGYYHLFVPDFMEKWVEVVLNNAVSSGATESELAAKTEQMEQFSNWFENPFFAILLTYAEVLPIGLVVALVSSLILKKNQKNNNN